MAMEQLRKTHAAELAAAQQDLSSQLAQLQARLEKEMADAVGAEVSAKETACAALEERIASLKKELATTIEKSTTAMADAEAARKQRHSFSGGYNPR